MEVDHTCPDVRYLSEILCCTIPIQVSDPEVKVIDFEIVEAKRDSDELRRLATVLIFNEVKQRSHRSR